MHKGGTSGADGIRKLRDPQLGDILAWPLAPSSAKAPNTADTLSMTSSRERASLPRPGFPLCQGLALASPVLALRPQTHFCICRDHSLSQTKQGRRDSWRPQQNRSGENQDGEGWRLCLLATAQNAAVPPVGLQLQNRHSALTLLWTNTQQRIRAS